MAIDKNLSEYELERLERIAENKRKIAELGLGKRPTEKLKKKPPPAPPPSNLHFVERRISSRDRKTVRHTSLAGLDVKGKKGNADTEFFYKKDDDEDDNDDHEDVVSDDGILACPYLEEVVYAGSASSSFSAARMLSPSQTRALVCRCQWRHPNSRLLYRLPSPQITVW